MRPKTQGARLKLIGALLLWPLATGHWPLNAATKIFLRNSASLQAVKIVDSGYPGYGCNTLTGALTLKLASTTQGAGVQSKVMTPSSSAPPCDTDDGTQYLLWLTPPISAAVTISGNIDYQVGCSHSSPSLNDAVHFVVYRWSRGGLTSIIQTSADRVECNSANAAIAAAAPTSTSMLVDDRIAFRVEVSNVGGAWGGDSSRTHTLSIEAGGTNLGATWANFADTITFAADSWKPSGYVSSLHDLLHGLLERIAHA